MAVNRVANFLQGIGWIIIICGFVTGSFLGGSANQGNDFDFLIFAIFTFSGLVSGIFFIALAEIIYLLTRIAAGNQQETIDNQDAAATIELPDQIEVIPVAPSPLTIKRQNNQNQGIVVFFLCLAVLLAIFYMVAC